MKYNKIMGVAGLVFCLAACKENSEKGKFTLHGDVKNITDQKVYLEQVFFSEKDPQILDSAELKSGAFSVSATADEEGLYRLMFEKQETGYIFINDQPDIKFKADATDMTLDGPSFNTAANAQFKTLLENVSTRQKELQIISAVIDSLSKNSASDSLKTMKITQAKNAALEFKHYILNSIDSLSDPVVAMFAVGYTKGIDPAELKTVVPALAKRFPDHKGVAGIIASYNQMMAAKASPQQSAAPPGNVIAVGSIAPELTMADTEGNMFSLSSLKGKYVLVDFWASWCGPCRGENPNVVANYNKYKDKNFTILGVSLDEDKAAWIKAIKTDKLAWKGVSDLKGWNSAAVTTYGFDAIPYNVLIDPTGKIIATELREQQLGAELQKVLGK